MDQKFIFHFLSAQNEFFLWRTYHIFVAKLDQINFLKYWTIFNVQLTKWLRVKFFDPPLTKKTNFCRFSRKRSNLNYSCLIVCSLFFPKIISRYISIYLIRETPKVLQDSTPSYERSWPQFWPHFETGIRNSKKIVNLRIVSLCDLVSRKNKKRGLRQMF